ncbi:MAG: hypothetical protein CMJ18_13200 [Phycisphaeraceae bacterium]|nr:hypothetical protein [Phycisphaeraceae bacterium]
MPEQFVEIALDGSTMRTRELPSLNAPARVGYGSMIGLGALTPPSFVAAVTIAQPLFGALQNLPSRSPVESFMDNPGPNSAFVLTLLMTGAICAGLMGRVTGHFGHARRARIEWAIAGFLLGLAGIVLFFCLRRIPARETCEGCGRRRVVDRDECEHCGAPFASTSRDGTEIFAA